MQIRFQSPSVPENRVTTTVRFIHSLASEARIRSESSGTVTVAMSSVRVRPSVTLVDCDQMHWDSREVTARINMVIFRFLPILEDQMRGKIGGRKGIHTR